MLASPDAAAADAAGGATAGEPSRAACAERHDERPDVSSRLAHYCATRALDAACVTPGGRAPGYALYAAVWALDERASHEAGREEHQPPRISRDRAEAAGWPDDHARGFVHSRDSPGGRLPLDSKPNYSPYPLYLSHLSRLSYALTRREPPTHREEYTVSSLGQALAPDHSNFSYSYSLYRQPLHIVPPASP